MPDYIALIHKDADSDYSVSFPDTAGSTIDEARVLAAEALAVHVEGIREDGEELPAPTPMAAVMTERENRDAVAFLVTLPDQAQRHVRIQVTMAEGLVREIDARTNNRASFLAAAAELVLQQPIAARSRGQGGAIRLKRGEVLKRPGAPTLKKKR